MRRGFMSGSPALLLVVMLVVTLPAMSSTAFANAAFSDSLSAGPYVDKLRFLPVYSLESSTEALLNGTIDILVDGVSAEVADELEGAEDIAFSTAFENSYGYLQFNTYRYPFNITAFRRAVAFALDKNSICGWIGDGLVRPLDSLVPACNALSIEDELPYSYYYPDDMTGNHLLDAAGFLDTDSDGYREAPDQSELNITVDLPSWPSVYVDIVAQELRQAMLRLDIAYVYNWEDPYDYTMRIEWNGDYDMAFFTRYLPACDLRWLADPIEVCHVCGCGYRYTWLNSSYQSLVDQLLSASSYEDVCRAAKEMQRVFVYECPYIVCYQHVSQIPYRTDKFEGQWPEPLKDVGGWWDLYKMKVREDQGGPFGGNVVIGTYCAHVMFNPWFSCLCNPWTQFIPYDTLVRISPDSSVIPWLAESYTIETHDDDSNVTEGNTRLTFQIVEDASWSDGTPLTANDAAFTLNSLASWSYGLAGLRSAYAPTTYTLVAEMASESYWHLVEFADINIGPRHIYQPPNSIHYSPDFGNGTIVTSGPFNFTEYQGDQYYVMSRNPDYFLSPGRNGNTSTTTQTSVTGIWLNPLSLAVTLSTSTVIVVVTVMWRRRPVHDSG